MSNNTAGSFSGKMKAGAVSGPSGCSQVNLQQEGIMPTYIFDINESLNK
jgi:hypothetical protein